MSASVLVVLVNYRRSEDTVACLESLGRLAVDGIKLKIAVCDNGSTLTSECAILDFLKSFGAVCTVEGAHTGSKVVLGRAGPHDCFFVASRANLGFAGGNNLAYRIASHGCNFEYVWFLNNDTEVAPDCLSQLLARMSAAPDIGICGATLVYSWDRTKVQCLGGCSINVWAGLVHQIGHGSRWPSAVDERAVEKLIDYPAGASMLVQRRFLEVVGLMSEDYFLFYEEIDWSVRARRAGFRMGYASRAIVYHKEGASIGTGNGATRSALAEYYGLRSKLLFTRRFYPWALPTVWLLSCLQVVRRLAQRQWRRAKLMALTLVGFGSAPVH
jgi:GT2 family glycosyltransferase